MFRLVVALLVAYASAYIAPQMSLGNKLSKAVGAAALSFALASPMVVNADGAVSVASVYRARVGYGNKILGLGEAAKSGKFDAFDSELYVQLLQTSTYMPFRQEDQGYLRPLHQGL